MNLAMGKIDSEYDVDKDSESLARSESEKTQHKRCKDTTN